LMHQSSSWLVMAQPGMRERNISSSSFGLFGRLFFGRIALK